MYKPRCNEKKCFQNKCGTVCELLTGHPSTYPCPFFKTKEEVKIGRQEAHKKLADSGKWDLIRKYEYNPKRSSK